MLTKSQEFAKRLVRLAIHKAGGGKAASEWTGIDEGELSRFGSEHTDRHAPFFRILEINEASDDAILKSWARARGLELITKEQKRELTDGIAKLAGKMTTEFLGFTAAALNAGSDGICSYHEARTVDAAREATVEAIQTAAETVISMPRVRGA